ncbi:hypothetical protein KIN20_004182 [Parelaphostrongylus tenuis]|uniref:Neurotransmitter-gated ion-channel transmembrane domain-containing protein n=1 Tax=Parelaphostrongylus tenuis TaxID=148309 RepID=A0AAD5QHV9_PARTN|nr:hypothetical protein KIN20_004182 [Parelaphostrongylus tenuis]
MIEVDRPIEDVLGPEKTLPDGYTTSEVLMKWNYPKAVHGVEEADVPQFTVTGFQTEDRVVRTATGSYQRLSLVFQLQRSVGYFIFQTYLPCVLIVMLSWVSFWINHEATSARVALGRWSANNMNKEDRESAVNMKNWGIPSSLMSELQQSSSDPRTHVIDSKQTALPTRCHRRSSPIPSLCQSGHNGEDDTPEYPRYMSNMRGMRSRPSFSARTRRRMRMTKIRATNMTTSLYRMSKRARKAIPSIRLLLLGLLLRNSALTGKIKAVSLHAQHFIRRS